MGSRDRKCVACERQITGKEIFGSGRFCSSLCATLRTPEKHFEWMQDHPDEYKKWQEEHNKEIGATGPVVFPAP